MSRPANLRPAPGTRPAEPVRAASFPDCCRLCTWVVRERAWSPPGPRERFWELKYVNAACLEHARLPVV